MRTILITVQLLIVAIVIFSVTIGKSDGVTEQVKRRGHNVSQSISGINP